MCGLQATKRSAAAAAEGGAAAEAAAPPSAELQAQVERLPRAAAAAVDRITLQVHPLRVPVLAHDSQSLAGAGCDNDGARGASVVL